VDVVTLLHRAHDAGLRLKAIGDQLLVEGPRRAEPLVRLLVVHKAAVMAALTESDNRAGLAPKEPLTATDVEYWRDFFDERAAYREFDGGYSRAEAERLAFGEMLLEWHRRHGTRPDPHRCAGCGDDMPGQAGLVLCDSARVHFDAVHGVNCITAYGKKWRGAAVAALRQPGFDPPEGFEPLS
jgi:hypothetical protein